ncbi:DUF4263 domain-containing protein [Candidatus Woesearchaeota archaeon]|nr:DUF4263 domain-containing protein [Candidatus Woesearchaeota archaeon]
MSLDMGKYIRVLSMLLKKVSEDSMWIRSEIDKKEILDEIKDNKLDSSSTVNVWLQPIGGDNLILKLKRKGIIRDSIGGVLYHPIIPTSSYFDSDERYEIDVNKLKEEVNNLGEGNETKSMLQLVSKLDSKKEQIQKNLGKLKDLIKNKEKESIIHNFIKKKNLLRYKDSKHEFLAGSQNRYDFIFLNEYGEYELWELKSPSKKLFKCEYKENKGHYQKVKQIHKTPDLMRAIEQILVYKQWLIYNCKNNEEHDLDKHVYNAKLVVVMGSSDELKNPLIVERLNLERHAYNNLNIITYDMFYEKIEKQFSSLLN